MMKSSNLVRPSLNESDTASYSHDGGRHEDQEESGWTAYFDDYFSNKALHHPSASKHMNQYTYDYDGGEGCGGGGSMCCNPSTISDAASCADSWKKKNQYKTDDERNRKAEMLQAAACSSFHGAQMVVIHNKLRFKPANNRRKRFSDCVDDSLEDTASSPVNSPKAKRDYGYGHQKNELKQQVEDANRVLEKKGLCLVPYSMLTNYIG